MIQIPAPTTTVGRTDVNGGLAPAPSAAPPERPGPVDPAPRDVPGLPFARLLRLELRKALDTRAGRGLLVSIVLLTVLSIGLTLWFSRDGGASFQALLTAAGTPQGVLLPVLGILTACSEWSQRTALVTFAHEPRRLRVMNAKALAAVVIGLVVLAATFVLAALAHLGSVAVADASADLSLGWAQTVQLTLAQTQNVLLGIAFGALLLNVPVAIVAFFVAPVVVNLLTVMVGVLGRHAEWFDLAVGAAPLLGTSWLTGEQWLHVASGTLIWLVLPLAVGYWRVARGEVK